MAVDVYDEIETWSPSQLHPLESERFLRQMGYVVARSPFYRQKFANAGVDATCAVRR